MVCPLAFWTANSALWLWMADGRLLADGSVICVKLLKYSTLLPTMWTLPEGIGPFNTAVAVEVLLKVPPALSVKVVGEPEYLLKMTAVCHFSTTRATTPWVDPRNFLFGPSGTSKIPLLVMTFVRSKLNRRLSR